MSDDSEAKIQRWERYIEECRREAKLLSPEGQIAMQTVIESYETLIAIERSKKSYAAQMPANRYCRPWSRCGCVS
jgi:hypothetical protein